MERDLRYPRMAISGDQAGGGRVVRRERAALQDVLAIDEPLQAFTMRQSVDKVAEGVEQAPGGTVVSY
jgi:hypothetical protein